MLVTSCSTRHVVLCHLEFPSANKIYRYHRLSLVCWNVVDTFESQLGSTFSFVWHQHPFMISHILCKKFRTILLKTWRPTCRFEMFSCFQFSLMSLGYAIFSINSYYLLIHSKKYFDTYFSVNYQYHDVVYLYDGIIYLSTCAVLSER